MTYNDEQYLRALIMEISESNPVSDEDADKLLSEMLASIDAIEIPLTENTTRDVFWMVIWTIIDLVAVWIPPIKAAKGLKGAKLMHYLKSVLGSIVGNGLKQKWARHLIRFILAIGGAGAVMSGVAWNGESFGKFKFPLVGTENLKNKSKVVQGAGALARMAGETVFSPLGYIGRFTKGIENDARKLSDQYLKVINQEVEQQFANAQGVGKIVRKFWAKLKNTMFNGLTDTENVFSPEFFKTAKQAKINLSDITLKIGGEYSDYISKQYGSQMDQNTLQEFLQMNISNAAEWFGLDAQLLAQGAKISVGQTTNTRTNTGSTPQSNSQQIMSQFQQWSQSMFVDQQGQPLVADGKIGPKTRHVIQQFQQWANDNGYAQNMPVDGKWGPLTAAAFQAVQNAGQQQQNNAEDSNIQQQTDPQVQTADPNAQQQTTQQTTDPNTQQYGMVAENLSVTTPLSLDSQIEFYRSLLERMDYIKYNGSIKIY